MAEPPAAADPVAAAIRIGCSGWLYRHWRGAFYPQDLPVKRWFANSPGASLNHPIALVAVIALAACATQPQSDPGAAIAGFGATAVVGPVRVTPVALIEDSRCPQAIRCVWAGRVRIAARVNGGEVELTMGQPVPVAGGALLLAEVLPPRQPQAEIAPADYRFRFSFT